MNLLLDANLSPRVAAALRASGYDVAHVGDEGLLTAEDHVILAHAAESKRVIISADTDFGELLSAGERHRPSVVLLRSADHLTPERQASLLAANLPTVANDLEAGYGHAGAGPSACTPASRAALYPLTTAVRVLTSL